MMKVTLSAYAIEEAIVDYIYAKFGHKYTGDIYTELFITQKTNAVKSRKKTKNSPAIKAQPEKNNSIDLIGGGYENGTETEIEVYMDLPNFTVNKKDDSTK